MNEPFSSSVTGISLWIFVFVGVHLVRATEAGATVSKEFRNHLIIRENGTTKQGMYTWGQKAPPIFKRRSRRILTMRNTSTESPVNMTTGSTTAPPIKKVIAQNTYRARGKYYEYPSNFKLKIIIGTSISIPLAIVCFYCTYATVEKTLIPCFKKNQKDEETAAVIETVCEKIERTEIKSIEQPVTSSETETRTEVQTFKNPTYVP
ncbi:uncharacterized protein LOC141900854 [Tubulanus polymorphus]|uniref:uncharacterized protein LOC141900854 n=1 Tax=Tubulanus polymorphus TaxID=672921 RepID=UPI003DA6AA00